MGEQSHNAEKLTDVIDRIKQETEGDDQVSIQSVFDAFGGRLFGPILIVPSLVVLTPLGAVPGVPSAIGLVLILIAAQRLFGKRQPWLPKFVLTRSVSRKKVGNAFDHARPWAKRIDRLLRPRLHALIRGPMNNVIAGIIILLGALMPMLMLVPFAVAVPGGAVLLFGLAITAHDGLLALLGYLLTLGSLGLILFGLL